MANQRILYTEEMVGYGHPTKSDTLNRHVMVEHTEDGTHGAITPTSVTSAGPISGTTGTFTGAISADGGQIAFPATAVPSAGPNTLDDYEEGTATIAFEMSTSGTVAIDPDYDELAYTKIGRVVTYTGLLKISSVNSPVGTLRFTLPFTTGNASKYIGGNGIGTNGVDFATGTSPFILLCNNSTSVSIYVSGDGIGVSSVIPAADDVYYISLIQHT